MATPTETQDAYARHGLRFGSRQADVADVILKLEAERDDARARLSHALPEQFATLDDYIRTLNDENALFTYQAAERGFLLRDMLASGEAHQGWVPLEAFRTRLRTVLDNPEGAEARGRAGIDEPESGVVL